MTLAGPDREFAVNSLRRLCEGPLTERFSFEAKDKRGEFKGEASTFYCPALKRRADELSFKDILG